MDSEQPKAKASSSCIDEEVINSLKELETPGDEVPFLDELIHIFLIDAAVSVKNLVTAYQQKDNRGIERWAHKLKGQSRNLGARRLSEVCAVIESTAVKSPQDVSELLVQSASIEFEGAMQELRVYLRSA